MKENLNKVLLLTIVIHILIMFVINLLKPVSLYYYRKNEKRPIPFGYGKNKKIICVHTIGLVLPFLLYFLLFILS